MNINTGKPWSDVDLADLANCLSFGTLIEEIANFLCRDVDEVREKITALAARLDRYECGLEHARAAGDRRTRTLFTPT
jgi:hypothetical protein